jgi:hypothetical protein
MAISQPTSPYGSADALISGDLWLTASANSFMADFNGAFGREITSVLKVANEDFRKAALADQAWAHYADLVSIAYQDEEFTFVLSGSPIENQEIMDLEYGAPGVGDPNPLLRKTLISASKKASNKISLEMF